jgi:hypothetical protein
LAAQPGLRGERGSQGLQARAECRHARFPARLNVFQGPSEHPKEWAAAYDAVLAD